MKKLVLAVSLVVALAGCHDYKADIQKLQNEKDALQQASTYKDSTINSYMGSMNEIETNLATIEELQSRVAQQSKGGELQASQVERINENIRSINDLMKENKEKIASLSKKLKSSGNKVAGLEKMLANLQAQVEEKDKQLAELNTKNTELNTTVESLNTNVSTLTTENATRQATIDDQTLKLHTAYYTTGTAKELETKKVITKEGGFLGIGKSKKMTPDVNNTAFTNIDITKTSTIPLKAKDAVVLTSHPSDSYTIEHQGKEVSQLVITNPDKFWEASKYLVVVVDK
jgi:predicted nuclease with TOPRIM domain